MDYQDLKRQLDELSDAQKREYRGLLAQAALGGQIRPEYEACAEKASTWREFFDAVYADDALRFTRLWGAWAKADRKEWVARFVPAQAAQRVRLVRRAVPLEYAHGGALLVPADARGQHASVLVFEDESINTGAATFFTSIEGQFTCGDIAFDGTYDVFYYHGAVLFVKWAVNAQGQRRSEAQLAEEFCKNG